MTWKRALFFTAPYLTPWIWFIGGLYEVSTIGKVNNFITGIMFIIGAYFHVRAITKLRKDADALIASVHENGVGVGMFKALEHFSNGGDMEGLHAKIKSKLLVPDGE